MEYLLLGVFYARWLDRNEDDGQIVRELVPAGDGLRLHSESTMKQTNTLV